MMSDPSNASAAKKKSKKRKKKTKTQQQGEATEINNGQHTHKVSIHKMSRHRLATQCSQ